MQPLAPGDPTAVGPHRVLGRLGQGGMGTVFLGLTPDERAVAVKVLRDGPADADGRRRFRQELEVLRRVRGPHLVEVLDGDAEAATPWIVTRFVPGRRLDEVVADGGPLDPAALLRVALGVARGLQALHAAGVVHRDLTPGNVLLVDGEPYVIDLGLALVADVTALTRTGLVMGTAGYLAPEQVLGTGCGPAADVHAWAATVALAGTGRPPYGTGRSDAVLYRVVHAPPDLDGLPAEVADLVRRGLAKDAAARPAVAEVVSALAGLPSRDLVGVSSGPQPAGLRPPEVADVLGDGVTSVLGDLGAEVTEVLRREVRGGTVPLAREPVGDGTRVLPPVGERTQVLPPVGERTQAAPPVAARRRRRGGPPLAAPPLDPPLLADPPLPAPTVRRPGHLQRAVVLAPAVALLAAATLVLPLAVGGLAVLGLLVLQTGARDAAHSARTVARRGPRRRDPVVRVLGLPWRALGAALDLLLGLPLVAVAAALPGWLVAQAAGPGPGAAVAVVAGVLVTLSRRRFGSSRDAVGGLAAAAAPSPGAAAGLGLALLAVAGVLLLAAQGGPQWWPAQAAAGCPARLCG